MLINKNGLTNKPNINLNSFYHVALESQRDNHSNAFDLFFKLYDMNEEIFRKVFYGGCVSSFAVLGSSALKIISLDPLTLVVWICFLTAVPIFLFRMSHIYQLTSGKMMGALNHHKERLMAARAELLNIGVCYASAQRQEEVLDILDEPFKHPISDEEFKRHSAKIPGMFRTLKWLLISACCLTILDVLETAWQNSTYVAFIVNTKWLDLDSTFVPLGWTNGMFP